jgi:prepilin peptidase CpaA
MSTVHIIVLAVAAVACVWDLRTRRIPNWLTFGAAGGGLLFHLITGGGAGLGHALGGWALGLALFFVLFALGGMGAGDVKLLAALGAWLGAGDIFWLTMYTCIAGGALAILVSLARGYLRQAFKNIWLLLMHWRVMGPRPLPELTLETGRGPRLAYALPILAGTMVTIWLQ